jgi:hypothetical protein
MEQEEKDTKFEALSDALTIQIGLLATIAEETGFNLHEALLTRLSEHKANPNINTATDIMWLATSLITPFATKEQFPAMATRLQELIDRYRATGSIVKKIGHG